MIRTHKRQSGAALIIGLILLAIITLLAVVGMNISNSELASATAEQLHQRSFRAAETGLEHGLDGMFKVPPGTAAAVVATPVGTDGSPKDGGGQPIDKYGTSIQYRGEGHNIGGFSSGFSAFHYTVLATGTSARDTTTTLEQGAYIVNQTGGQQSYSALP